MIARDLQKKMVLLAGPRQCGKTYVAKQLLQQIGGTYYNWDLDADRRRIKLTELRASSRLWAFDEIHKWRSWRNWVKGVYDTHHEQHQILVTGSARLDLYHRRGDSLAGRYYLMRFHPLTVAELSKAPLPVAVTQVPEAAKTTGVLNDLLSFSGFPEPFLSATRAEYQRWQNNYQRALIREDLATLEAIRDLDKVETLYERLPDLIGSPLSINALREDVEVAFETVRAWISALERIYVCFRVAPYGPPKIRAVKKEQKLYLWDWARVSEPGARLENLVAVHLLHYCQYAEDVLGENLELRYFRIPAGAEVDFVVLRNKKPWWAIEIKMRSESVSPALSYFVARSPGVRAFQLHGVGDDDLVRSGSGGVSVRCMPVEKFLGGLV